MSTELEQTVDTLQDAAYEAAAVLRRLNNQRDDERRSAIHDFEQKFTSEVLDPKYAEPIQAARDAQYEAERILREAKDAAAIEKAKTAPWPIGTRFVEWKSSYTRGPWKLKSSGEVAIIEMFTSTSLYPDNVAYGKPSVGELVLRRLKKDGSPSAKYIKAGRAWTTNEILFNPWFPEGTDPNDKKDE